METTATILTWLLVLVINGEMVQKETYEDRSTCLFVGTRLAMQSAWLEPPDPDERTNPYAPRQQINIDGFFCERQEPEKVSQVVPQCLAPTRECS